MAAHQARTEVITSVGNINLQPLAQIFSNRKAALRVFQQEETIKIPVRVELDQKGKFQFVADIPADDNAEDRLKTLKTVLERFYEHFVPENEATEKKKRIFNLDTVRKHMTSLKAKAANAERRHAADAEKAGQTPNVTPTFALVQTAPPVTAAVVSKLLQKIRSKVQLTRFLEGGKLEYSPSEIWDLTTGQKEFVAEFPKNLAMIVKGPAGTGKTEMVVRLALEMLINGETDQLIISAPVDEGKEAIGFRKGSDHEKMNGHINQILEAMDGHLGQGDAIRGRKLREEMVDAGIIEISNLGQISGRNLRRKVLIVDEAHKADMQFLLLCLTRVHTNGSKVILMGDERQFINAGVSDWRAFVKRFANPAYKGLVGQITFKPGEIRRSPLARTMSERGDDIPPALAKRMMEEQITPEVRAGLLRAHFASIGEKGPKADPLSEKLAQEMIRRMQPEEVFALLHLQVHGKPFELEAPSVDGQSVPAPDAE